MRPRQLLLPILCLLVGALVPLPAAATTPGTLDLDGDGERVVVPNAPALNPTGGVTIEAWVRPRTTSGCQTLVGKDFQTSYWLGLCSGRVRYYTNGSGTSLDGSAVLPIGSWTHVAVTFDGTTRRYYVNGLLDFEANTPSPLPVNAADLGIGGEAEPSSIILPTVFPLDGNLAEVRLWDRARSLEEIRHDFGRQLDGPEPGLVAVWPLEGGPEELLGAHPGSVREGDGDEFAGLAAPPRPHDPLLIPQLASLPAVDGSCGDEYAGAAELPIWETGGSENPLFAKVGATGSFLAICVSPMSISDSEWVDVHLDAAGDGGLAPEAGDYQFRVFPNGDAEAFVGSGSTFLPFLGTDVPGFEAAAGLFGEFEWQAEFRIPRSLIPEANTLFGLDLIHTRRVTSGDPLTRHGWPDDQDFVNPSTWELAQVDPTPPRPDRERPRATLFVSPSERPPAGETTTFRVNARDDVDVASVAILLGGPRGRDLAVERVCDAAGTDDRSVTCTLARTLAVGLHTVGAEVIDHRGRVGRAPFRTVRVVVDGTAPEVELSHTPEEPAPGEPVTLRAHARDAAGLRRIQLRGAFASELERCEPVGDPAEADCAVTVNAPDTPGFLRFDAVALDAEGFITETPDRLVLVGNAGPDGDGDGIADAVEARLCTDPGLRDTDRDALEDGWEIQGLRVAGGGFVDLPNLGAQPCTRDVFLQFDYETGADLPDDAFEIAMTAYRDHGITLHVERNERPRPPVDPVSPLNGLSAAYQRDDSSDFYFEPARNWTHVYGYSHHRPGRSSGGNGSFTIEVYSGAEGVCDGGARDGQGCRGDFDCFGGTCRAVCNDGPNADAFCSEDADCPESSCGRLCRCPLDEDSPEVCGLGFLDTNCSRRDDGDLVYRFFHELGHAVGLGHGGRSGSGDEVIEEGHLFRDGAWDNVNDKPQYWSSMNYRYTPGPLCQVPRDAGGSDWIMPVNYAERGLPTLREGTLDERATSDLARALPDLVCRSADPDAVPTISYTCADPDELDAEDNPRKVTMVTDGERTLARRVAGAGWETGASVPQASTAGIDWDCDGAIEVGVSQDLNDADGLQTLVARPDWDRIPNLRACLWPYSRSDKCYLQPSVYRLAMGADARDCRGSAPELDGPDVTCANIPAILDFGASGAGAPSEVASADPSLLLPPREQDPRIDESFPPPDLELCNGRDDDGDGAMDEGCADRDGDDTPDALDNCPETPNPDQADRDADGLGDACQDPQVGQLEAQTFQGQQQEDVVLLTWSAPLEDVRGFAVYRESDRDPGPRYLGSGYPSTDALQFLDPTPGAGRLLYHVRAVNRNGVESDAITVEIQVPEPGELAVLAAALGALAGLRRRRPSRRAPSA